MSREELPEGWAETTLGETGRYINGLAFKPEDWELVGRPIIRIQNLTDPSKPFNRTTQAFAPEFIVSPGDILVSWSASLDAFLWEREEGILNQHIFRVEPNYQLVDHRFLFHLLRKSIGEMIQGEHLHGSTMKHINRGPFLAHVIGLPPLAEQKRIVARLDALQARSRAAREALAEVPALLETFRQSVLAAAFRGDLTAEWRAKNPDVEPASKLLERIRAERKRRWEEANPKKRYVEPEPVDDSDLPDLPEGWTWARLQDLATVGTGATPKRGNPRFWSGGTVPWVTSGVVNLPEVTDATEKVTVAALQECNLTMYKPGTLLIAMYGEGKTRGLCTELRIDACTNQALAAIEIDTLASPYRPYLRGYLTLVYEQTRKTASGGVQPNLNLSHVRNIVHPVAPLAEAERLMEVATHILKLHENLVTELGAMETEVNTLDQSILARAFRGELVDQDPNDEPAATLLARIRGGGDVGATRRGRRAPTKHGAGGV